MKKLIIKYDVNAVDQRGKDKTFHHEIIIFNNRHRDLMIIRFTEESLTDMINTAKKQGLNILIEDR